uniref:Uncharacterized protein n=1 Tax=Arundo donax TaxID=35708 RepID=A0A0A9CMU8_ARUDO
MRFLTSDLTLFLVKPLLLLFSVFKES